MFCASAWICLNQFDELRCGAAPLDTIAEFDLASLVPQPPADMHNYIIDCAVPFPVVMLCCLPSFLMGGQGIQS